jgi:uncharacterized damage-inducible protein DinB
LTRRRPGRRNRASERKWDASNFAANNRINEYLIRAVPDAAWRATPPGVKGRTIAAMAAHIHNVRVMWLKSVGKDASLPAGSFLAYLLAHDAHHRGQIARNPSVSPRPPSPLPDGRGSDSA